MADGWKDARPDESPFGRGRVDGWKNGRMEEWTDGRLVICEVFEI